MFSSKSIYDKFFLALFFLLIFVFQDLAAINNEKHLIKHEEESSRLKKFAFTELYLSALEEGVNTWLIKKSLNVYLLANKGQLLR